MFKNYFDSSLCVQLMQLAVDIERVCADRCL